MIYIASKTIHAPRWRNLRNMGAPIISTWIDEAGAGESTNLVDLWSRCVNEARSCHALIAYREGDEILKGAFVEIGAALANYRAVYLVGFDTPNFSFKNHPQVTCCGLFDEAFTLALR